MTTQQAIAEPTVGSVPGPLGRRELRVALAGTGYIARWHADAIAAIGGTRIVGVCDQSPARADDFARSRGIERSFGSLTQMLEECRPDGVHVLTPAHTHSNLAGEALDSGCSVYLEKPMDIEPARCAAMVELAAAKGLAVGVGHNFLFYSPYVALRRDVRDGRFGPLNHVTINWSRELPLLSSGPFDAWMLREPGNIMLEVGAHSVAHMLDLVGPPDEIEVLPSSPKTLPTGTIFYRCWHIHALCDSTAVDLNFYFGPAAGEHCIEVRGMFGAARADLENNLYIPQRLNAQVDEWGRFSGTRTTARRLKRQARTNLTRSILTKARLLKAGDPYLGSIAGGICSFYEQLLGRAPLDPRVSGVFGGEVVSIASRIAAAGVARHERSGPQISLRPSSQPAGARATPTILVIGAGGFIGRQLVSQLVSGGNEVRALLRNPGSGVLDRTQPRLELFQGDATRPEDLTRALRGIQYVFHLARPRARTWAQYLQQDVQVTRSIAQACLEAGVKRLVYTGTIDSLDLAARHTLTDASPLDPKIDRRNHYARAKAVGEKLLMHMHQQHDLPVVCVRPAIVIGRGASPCHWGVGMWHGLGLCQFWGRGDNPLPLVLVQDVAAALALAMDKPGIDGRAYNLSSPACLTARDYVQEMEKHAGICIEQQAVPIWKFHAQDMTKWLVKLAVGHPGAERRPSYHDWKCRAQAARLDCSGAPNDLGWFPTHDPDQLIRRGIHEPLDEYLA